MSTHGASTIYLDLTSFKCPRSLIELKMCLSSMEEGHRLSVALNAKHDNRDVLAFIETSKLVVESAKKEPTAQIIPLIKLQEN